jgi:hypothetical protein
MRTQHAGTTRTKQRAIAARAAAALIASLLLVGACGGGSESTAPPKEAAETTSEPTETTPEPEPTPEKQELHGIVAISYSGEGSFTLSSIDPTSGALGGEVTFVRPEETAFAVSNYTPLFARRAFDETFDRVAATSTAAADGAGHVGWVDRDGIYTDVTAEVAGTASDFSDAVDHVAPKFGFNGRFYFLDKSSSTVKSVDPADLTAAPKDELKVEDISPTAFEIYPSGTIQACSGGCIPNVENTKKGPVGRGKVEDWLDEDTMLTEGIDNDQIFSNEAFASEDEIDSGFFGSGSDDDKPLLPETEARISTNPIASPDGKTVAFLSWPEQGEEPPSLFMVPAEGGEPRKVESAYSFTREDPTGFYDTIDGFVLLGWFD